MKKIVLGVMILSSALFSLEWQKDIDTALKMAQYEKKNVMVLIESKNCRWCTKMKHRTLTDESVEKRLEKYVLVKVMREDSKVMESLPHVQGVPTIFFMKENKAVIEEIIGYFNVQDFLSYMDDVEKKVK